MSVTPPENYTYGTVVGRFLVTAVDSADADRYPDLGPATGEVKFTPTVPWYKNLAMPATLLTRTHTATIDSQGYLVDERGARGVVLMSPQSPQISPQNWTYRVTITVGGRQLPAFDLPQFDPGQTLDLTTVVPATAAGPAVVTVVSEATRVAAELARDQAVAAANSVGLLRIGGGRRPLRRWEPSENPPTEADGLQVADEWDQVVLA